MLLTAILAQSSYAQGVAEVDVERFRRFFSPDNRIENFRRTDLTFPHRKIRAPEKKWRFARNVRQQLNGDYEWRGKRHGLDQFLDCTVTTGLLVVKDDAEVRGLAETTLVDLGYRVLSAADARAGLAALRAAPRIDLLLSDVVLPGGTSGPAMAAEAERLRPGLKVLFISGYADTVVQQKTPLPEDADLLDKPFRRHELARRVRAALER